MTLIRTGHLDYTANISITNPTGTMTGDPISAAAAAGLATFSTVIHTSAGTYTLNASSGALVGTTSASFIISSFAVGTYFTKTDGVWSSSPGNNTATWQIQTSGRTGRPWYWSVSIDRDFKCRIHHKKHHVKRNQ
ncbi:hypothetical protein [Flavobacterium sp. 3HN19-14]|uniref:hypothetical protein n=1 Tax=Flavobacterium sp. 3HN19-14 TaxID=3448133 RepID=UPI003EE2905A